MNLHKRVDLFVQPIAIASTIIRLSLCSRTFFRGLCTRYNITIVLRRCLLKGVYYRTRGTKGEFGVTIMVSARRPMLFLAHDTKYGKIFVINNDNLYLICVGQYVIGLSNDTDRFYRTHQTRNGSLRKRNNSDEHVSNLIFLVKPFWVFLVKNTYCPVYHGREVPNVGERTVSREFLNIMSILRASSVLYVAPFVNIPVTYGQNAGQGVSFTEIKHI